MTHRRFAVAFATLLLTGLTLTAFTLPGSSPSAPSNGNNAPLGATTASDAEPADDAVAWTLDKAHSEVRFRVRHLAISSVTGFFRDVDATVSMAPGDLASLSASATAQIESIDTGNADRDDHLRSPDFFDAETFPEMTFESTGVRNVNGDAFILDGDLTIRDVTRSVSFDGTMIGTAIGPKGKQRAAMNFTTGINRKDFGLTWNKLTEAGGVVVGDEVTIELDVQLIRGDA